MPDHTPRQRLLLAALLTVCHVGLHAEPPYRQGETIEYKVRGSYPPQWASGRFIRELPGATQYLIHEAPSRFFPEGSEVAYSPTDLRRPQSAQAPAAPDIAAPAPPASNITVHTAHAPAGDGLLGREALLAYARGLMGEQPFADSAHRERVLLQIRDTIKARGTDFQYSATDDFANRMNAQGTLSSHIGFAINSNFGPAPRLEDYFGTFHLRAASRGSQSVRQEGGRVIVTTTDAQHESGALTIERDGTYVWATLRGSPPETWKRGRWRQAAPAEMLPWEAGPAIWLMDAKQGGDYLVRMDRQPGWRGWIEVGAGAGRTPVEYGRRP